VRIVVDTGIFSASLSRRRRSGFDAHVHRMAGNQIFLAAVTVSELRYGALVAGRGCGIGAEISVPHGPLVSSGRHVFAPSRGRGA
jgi:predicted nucleic acid-binding protein